MALSFAWKGFQVSIFIFLLCGCSAECYPLHASCKLQWKFSATCSFVHTALRNQMDTWSGSDCGSGEKCLYEVTSDYTGILFGTHTTPIQRYVDDLEMYFTDTSDGCTVDGFSEAETTLAYLDSATNYCNLHNLVEGAGLDTSEYGFEEITSDAQCTQYSTADCEKY